MRETEGSTATRIVWKGGVYIIAPFVSHLHGSGYHVNGIVNSDTTFNHFLCSHGKETPYTCIIPTLEVQDVFKIYLSLPKELMTIKLEKFISYDMIISCNSCKWDRYDPTIKVDTNKLITFLFLSTEK
uniref:Uncharacterized protein n=1 Tax=Cacopsylla melanoneura TaxID=428564 RepID=A0A8D8VU36_9HEMI